MWIGDLPRILVTQYGCKIHHATLTTLKPGDLIFLRKGTDNTPSPDVRYIVHIMVAVSTNAVFHSTRVWGGGKIESNDSLCERDIDRRVIDEPFLFLRYIDDRNQRLRKKHQDQWLTFAVPRPVFTFEPLDAVEA